MDTSPPQPWLFLRIVYSVLYSQSGIFPCFPGLYMSEGIASALDPRVGKQPVLTLTERFREIPLVLKRPYLNKFNRTHSLETN